MTDQLEHDLRTMLQQRAAEVIVEVAQGEVAVAHRLGAADTGMAEVPAVPVGQTRRPVLLLVAAAAVVVVAIAVALAATGGAPTVRTEPAGPSAPGPEVTTTTAVPPDTTIPARDPLLGEEGESAKDVAERVLAEILEDPSVTMAAEDRDDATFVTLQTSTGAEVVARVVFDMGPQRFRLTDLASPGMSGLIDQEAGLTVTVPEAGTFRIRSFPEDFSVRRTPVVDQPVGAGSVGPLLLLLDHPDLTWLSVELTTDDGRVLRLLSRR